MDGAASDLRTGLPWQTVEIHEPVRLLFIVETTPETLLRIMNRNPLVNKLIRNGWVQLATLCPTSSVLHLFQGRATAAACVDDFVPYAPSALHLPSAESSADWYRGWRDNLDFVTIQPTRTSDQRRG
jgi:hypothetical protein